MARNPIDYRTDVWMDWCIGCGNFGIAASIYKAFAEMNIDPAKTVIVSGIGCSGKMSHFVKVNGVHALHGRDIAFATGIKIANPELTVIVHGGDGDILGIGACHFVALGRRNIDMTVVMHDNGVYGLTKGQASPTLRKGLKTKSLAEPNMFSPVNPIALALASGYTFVARGYSMYSEHLKDLIIAAVKHRGSAFLDVFQPCVTYNDINTADYYKKRIYRLEEQPEWDPVVREQTKEAIEKKVFQAWHKSVEEDDKIPIGTFYQNPDEPILEDTLRERMSSYRDVLLPKQAIARDDGSPIIDTEIFKKLFSDYIVKTKKQ
ncbi:MAG: 2-oxoacid:ferredoxin oxidoreductase subunit beta [Nitrososphaeria archaeon]|jgi:2-oxoglutarate ferredoxin oxidoreductase subunit beta